MFLCGLELGKDVWLQEETGKVLLLGKVDGKMDAKEMLQESIIQKVINFQIILVSKFL